MARVTQVGDRLRIQVEIDGAAGVPELIGLDDRVGAAGGSIAVDDSMPGALRLLAELPCV